MIFIKIYPPKIITELLVKTSKTGAKTPKTELKAKMSETVLNL